MNIPRCLSTLLLYAQEPVEVNPARTRTIEINKKAAESTMALA
jgi:hypothetical protein